MNLYQEAMLSGIVFPEPQTKELERLRFAQRANQEQVEKLEREQAKLEAQIEEIDADSQESLNVKSRFAQLFKKGEAARKKVDLIKEQISQLHRKGENLDGQIRDLFSEIEKHLRAELSRKHQEMTRQVERVVVERAKNRGERIPSSSPPEVQSDSRIAVCEICRQKIGIFAPENICQPVTANHFVSLHGNEQPFPPGAEFLHFFCPACGARPWNEPDKVLTNAGYFVVPSEKSHEDKSLYNSKETENA